MNPTPVRLRPQNWGTNEHARTTLPSPWQGNFCRLTPRDPALWLRRTNDKLCAPSRSRRHRIPVRRSAEANSTLCDAGENVTDPRSHKRVAHEMLQSSAYIPMYIHMENSGRSDLGHDCPHRSRSPIFMARRPWVWPGPRHSSDWSFCDPRRRYE